MLLKMLSKRNTDCNCMMMKAGPHNALHAMLLLLIGPNMLLRA
jgi:hypothetical protein